MVELDDGSCMQFIGRYTPFTSDTLNSWPYKMRVSADGTFISEQPCIYQGEAILFSSPLRPLAGTGFISFSIPEVPPLYSGLNPIRLDEDLNVIATTEYEMIPDMRRGPGNTCLDSQGDLILCLAFNQTGSGSTFDQLLFWRTDENGDSLASRVYAGTDFAPLDMLPSATGFDVLFWYAVGLGPVNGYGKILQFDAGFNYTGGFAIPGFNGQPLIFGQDSVADVQEFIHTPDGGFLVTGTMIEDIRRAFVMRLSATGALEDLLFTPDMSGEPYPTLQGLIPLDDGTYAWAVAESQVWQQHGARSHVYKLDAELNILGHITLTENEITGGPEPLFMLKAQDNSLVLCGNLVGDGVAPHVWMAKLGEFVGVHDHLADAPHVTAFPNPGTDQLNIRAQHGGGGTLALYDLQGRCVMRWLLVGGQADVPTADLSPGLYHFVLLGTSGEELGRGRWVRE